jgi:Family of unknown function (DUF6230)
MVDDAVSPAAGSTRWRRFFLVLAPAYLLVAGILVLGYTGAVAVSFSIAGVPAKVSTEKLETGAADGNGVGFYQFGLADVTGSGAPAPQAETIVPNATLTRLCQSVSVSGVVFRLTAGDAGTPVSASNLVIDASSLTATSATFGDINIGQDMGTFSNPTLQQPTLSGLGSAQGPNVPTGNVPRGTFGQVARTATINGVQQVSNATAATSFTLPNLHLAIGFGSGGDHAECF